jgi:signal transduction histidine kinase
VGRRFRVSQPRLRTRITATFAAGAMILSLMLALVTYGITRENLLRQREDAALSQAYTNAKNLQSQISQTNPSDQQLRTALSSLETPTGSRPLLRATDTNGQVLWVAATTQFGIDALPPSLRDAVIGGEPAVMRYDYDGEPELAVGLPLPQANASYFEIVSLRDVSKTLDSLGSVLAIAVALTSVAGIIMGWWAGRRTLRPLSDVGIAAEAIAGGRLSTRLDAVDDPDLASLVGSFNHMATALEDRIERDARFASDVSHELRSPLMTLAASMEVLESRRDDIPDGPPRSALDLMSADVRRFQQLVEDLLEISRYDAGAVRLDLDEVRLPELVLQAVAAHRGSQIPVDVDADLAGVVVRADKRRLVRVMANLLDNAAKYGGGATRVALRRADDRVRLEVIDSGPGVPEEERAVIFERFNRGSGAGRRSAGSEGVGLGLALVAEHAKLHGGTVWVEDRADGESGAVFVLELPVAIP